MFLFQTAWQNALLNAVKDSSSPWIIFTSIISSLKSCGSVQHQLHASELRRIYLLSQTPSNYKPFPQKCVWPSFRVHVLWTNSPKSGIFGHPEIVNFSKSKPTDGVRKKTIHHPVQNVIMFTAVLIIEIPPTLFSRSHRRPFIVAAPRFFCDTGDAQAMQFISRDYILRINCVIGSNSFIAPNSQHR